MGLYHFVAIFLNHFLSLHFPLDIGKMQLAGWILHLESRSQHLQYIPTALPPKKIQKRTNSCETHAFFLVYLCERYIFDHFCSSASAQTENA